MPPHAAASQRHGRPISRRRLVRGALADESLRHGRGEPPRGGGCVTADGAVRTANACTNPDLFWGLKGGGGGGSLGWSLASRCARTPCPSSSAVFVTLRAASDAAFPRLIGRMIDFCSDEPFNPRWGEQIVLRPGTLMAVAKVFHGLDQQQAEATWRPFLDWLAASPQDFTIVSPPRVLAAPARRFWDPEFLRNIPGLVLPDDRPGAPPGAPAANVFWAGKLDGAGQVLHAYRRSADGFARVP
jgi:hypothetical protein